ncbi:hypothetical protein TNIN_421761 [Trichonephila inaurata madagascariensis]|uniref:Uncharacterized protein n=1 Tax=Trichonephila inaurata madagascariensis TaxID=2747483 RepID=A0A8X7CC79_9ARAC|nr:hypothetical protein TNIN_421761 [Trichonephila inaurata madagascariensis]
MEIIRNFFSFHHCTTQTGSKIPLSSLGQTVSVNNNRAIPHIRSTTIYAICHALDLKAQLIPIKDTTRPQTNYALKYFNTSQLHLLFSLSLFLKFVRH